MPRRRAGLQPVPVVVADYSERVEKATPGVCEDGRCFYLRRFPMVVRTGYRWAIESVDKGYRIAKAGVERKCSTTWAGRDEAANAIIMSSQGEAGGWSQSIWAQGKRLRLWRLRR